MEFIPYASGSTGNLYTLDDGKTRILIECGLPYREMQRVLPRPPADYAACLLTHAHGDHSCGAHELVRRGIPLHCSAETAGALELGDGWDPAGRPVATFSVRAFEVEHDVPTLGFLIRSRVDGESIVFATDTHYLRQHFPPVTIWAIECNFQKELLTAGDPVAERSFTAHMELETCRRTLLANDLSACREIHLLHISRERGNAEAFGRTIEETTAIPTYAAPPRRQNAHPPTPKRKETACPHANSRTVRNCWNLPANASPT
jgi:glyoxylase-like metal-dependent hydrolase (beta-lactamase superfamily II)